jgi:D-3-phosphoglycerate dehydrogenase
MKRILVATDKPFALSAIRNIKSVSDKAGYELRLLEKYTEKSQLLEAVADVDAIIIRSDIVDAEVLEAARKLKIVVRAGAGYDNIDLAAAKLKGVVAMNTPGQNANAVAELVFGMMLMQARNRYDGKSGTELMGKKIGIHAFGNVGVNVARIALGFGMKVFAYDPFVKKEVMIAYNVTPVDNEEELYKTCQYVSLHIPANDKTKKSINYQLIKIMPFGATLINTARKEVIDEDALSKMFSERKDFIYLTDIEPSNNAELSRDFAARYFATPKKMGAQTAEANVNAGIAAANQIVRFFENGDTTFQVNK